MTKQKILVVRKMSALEYYYNGNHENPAINESHENHNRAVKQISKILSKSNVDFNIITRRELTTDLVSEYDAVISAGGDGTVIATAFYNKGTPQLNLKTDFRSAGALCQDKIKASIENYLSGKYSIEKWNRQDVYLDGVFQGRASNEVCIGEQLKFSKLARYDLSFIDSDLGLRQSESQSSSGLVIVTGTGSTAWPNAFKPFPKDSTYFEFNNLLMHSGNIARGKADSLLIDYHGHEGKFAIDTVEYDFPRGSQLEIVLSDSPLNVIIPGV